MNIIGVNDSANNGFVGGEQELCTALFTTYRQLIDKKL